MSRQLSDVEDVLQNALNKHGLSVVPLLQEIQEHFRYLPEEVLRMLSRKTGIPLIEIYHAATFYNSLSLMQPQGTRSRYVPELPAIRGGGKLIGEIFQVLGIRPGEITPMGNMLRQ